MRVVKEQWWIDYDVLPEQIWARLRVFEDGSASVFDCDGRTTNFADEDTARMFLIEDEYAVFDRLEDSEKIVGGGRLAPPAGATDAVLLPQMLRRVDR